SRRAAQCAWIPWSPYGRTSVPPLESLHAGTQGPCEIAPEHVEIWGDPSRGFPRRATLPVEGAHHEQTPHRSGNFPRLGGRNIALGPSFSGSRIRSEEAGVPDRHADQARLAESPRLDLYGREERQRRGGEMGMRTR